MADELTPDICVIGAGPGGQAAALRAAEAGVRVVLVEKNGPGGAYVGAGAVASRAFAAAAETNEWLRRGASKGVSGEPLQVNLGRVRDHIGSVVDAVSARMTAERLTALGVTVVAGPAKFIDQRTIEVAQTIIRPRRFILATGAMAVPPAIPGLDKIAYLTPQSAFDAGRKPSHLVVLGASGHGLEIAQAYSRLGIDTTVLDAGDPLVGHDREHVDIVVDRLRAEGVQFRCGVDIASVSERRGGVRFAVTQNGATEADIDGSHVIAVGGRAPRVDDLDLDKAGIDHGPEGVSVNARLRTTNRRVFAIGDAVGPPYSVARARHHAACVVRSIVFGQPSRPSEAAVVRVVNTDPGIAAVGWNEEEAKARQQAVRVLRFPFSEVDQALIGRMPDGVVKVIAAPRGRVLGATIVGQQAADLITPWALALAQRLPVSALADLPVARPSLSEATVGAASMFGRGEADLTHRWRARIIQVLRVFG